MIRDREMMEHLWLYTPTAAMQLDESNYSSQYPTAVRRVTRVCIAAAVLALLLMGALVAFGQTVGKIAGTVKDATGAVLPNCHVVLLNTATGAKQETQTDNDGNFAFPVVGVGVYQIDTTADGFKPRRTEIRIDINTAINVDVVMQVAGASTDVLVDANATQISTTDTQIGQTIAAKQVTDVPLNG
jgi:hypothetical protein